MTKTPCTLQVNGKTFTVFKLDGEGLSHCDCCQEQKGWSVLWTSMCWEYKDKMYCYDCLQKVLAEEAN